MDSYTHIHFLVEFLQSPFSAELWAGISMFIPFTLLLEVPVYVLVLTGIAMYHSQLVSTVPVNFPYSPKVSCLVICYSEGKLVENTIRCLAEQIYPGYIEIIAVIDGAKANMETYNAARSQLATVNGMRNRRLIVVPKWQRGGRVSGLNTGLELSQGSVVMALDGDTSFDNTMVAKASQHFIRPEVMAVSGALRVRNQNASLVTRLQGLEYLLSIHAGRTGLSAFNMINNVSGAFGVFRRSILEHVSGWDSGTAEDLDLTLRLKAYFGRHPHLRIIFEPEAVGHTDAPETLLSLFQQRLRWDGDLFYLYFRKHSSSFSHRLLGWRNFLFQTLTGVMFQVFTPILIIVYMSVLVFTVPFDRVVFLMGMIYIFYFFIGLLLFSAFVLLVSERRRADLKMFPYLFLFPIYTFIIRCMSAFAIIWSLVARSHLDSNMAPWWVLKKTRF